ncbi:hypothetical protein GCM10008986_16950 [Salinibacillus aidingensis]|uniref:Uncharacterized protein n=1 Tax=Salinibacillus aidingensis TaxID=237684 RepID=A0ABN1B6R4_9BACI
MRKCKTASFDLEDKYETDLLEFAEDQGKFSKYVKRLIAADKEKNSQPTVIQTQNHIQEPQEPETEGDVDSFF